MEKESAIFAWREYVKECWNLTKVHWLPAAIGIAAMVMSAVQKWVPFVEVGGIGKQLDKIPKIPLPWALVIVLCAFCWILMKGGTRKVEELKQTRKALPNLTLHSARTPNISRSDGVWNIGGLPNTTRLAQTVFISNEPTLEGVSAVKVKARLVLKKEPSVPPFSPLYWVDERGTEIQIGPGDCKELILATRDEFNKDCWDYLVGSLCQSEIVWIPFLEESQFEIELINAETGTLLPVLHGLKFVW
jgi:hypothetical protein